MRPIIAPAIVCLALCSAITAHADPAADARRAIQAAYNASGAAAARKDAAGTLAHFTSDAVAVDTKGRTTSIAQQRRTAAQLFAAARSVSARTTIRKFTLDRPGQATATVHEHSVLTLASPQTQQPVRLEVDDTARDLWVKTGKGWRQKRSTDLTYASTLNGQPLPSP